MLYLASTTEYSHPSEVKTSIIVLEGYFTMVPHNNDAEVRVVDSDNYKHLGVERNNQSTNKAIIHERTMIGRRTTYAYMDSMG